MKRWRIVRDPVHQAGRTFVLAFFLTFTILGVLLTMQAVRVFHGIDQRALDTHTRAVPLAYLTGAVRRADATGGIGIAFLPDGEQALRTRENGHTWFYICAMRIPQRVCAAQAPCACAGWAAQSVSIIPRRMAAKPHCCFASAG